MGRYSSTLYNIFEIKSNKIKLQNGLSINIPTIYSQVWMDLAVPYTIWKDKILTT